MRSPRCCLGSTSAMPPDAVPTRVDAHLRALETLYASAPINRWFASTLALPAGRCGIDFSLSPDSFHAAGAAHDTLYLKMLDDAAFYAANTLVSDRFLLTTAFNAHFTKALKRGQARAEGRWISGRRRVFVAEARTIDSSSEECVHDTGTFLRLPIALSGLVGYRATRDGCPGG